MAQMKPKARPTMRLHGARPDLLADKRNAPNLPRLGAFSCLAVSRLRGP